MTLTKHLFIGAALALTVGLFLTGCNRHSAANSNNGMTDQSGMIEFHWPNGRVDKVPADLGTDFSPAPGYNRYLTPEEWNSTEHQEALRKMLANENSEAAPETPATPETPAK